MNQKSDDNNREATASTLTRLEMKVHCIRLLMHSHANGLMLKLNMVIMNMLAANL